MNSYSQHLLPSLPLSPLNNPPSMEREEEEEEEVPLLFRCPISMELMENPVTISTGITYERKNIEKWFFSYRRSRCPATMQELETFVLTPNITLRNLIKSWQEKHAHASPQPPSSPVTAVSASEHEKLVSLLSTVESTPFKVSWLKNLRSLIETSDAAKIDFAESGGIKILTKIMSQVAAEGADFSAFRACEESLAILPLLPLSEKHSAEILTERGCENAMTLVLQRGSAEARLNTMNVIRKLSTFSKDWLIDRDVGVIKSLLELLSDEISTKISSRSLDLLIEIVSASKKNRCKAIEAGAACVLIELLPDSNRCKCEKILLLLKSLCECPEGRSAFTDHGLGVAAVSKKILGVSDFGTKLGVKILWLICNFSPKEKVIHDMMVFGSVRKLIGLLHFAGRSSMKENAMKMLKLHGGVWTKYPCFPVELEEYLKLLHR